MKKFLSILMTVIMLVGMIPLGTTPVLAADNITEYDCLDVAAGAYIDTGIKPNENTRVVMDVTVMGKVEYWFGVWDIDFCHSAFALGNDSDGIYSGYYNEGGTDGTVVSDGRHTVELDKGVVKVDNAVILKHGRIPFALNNTLYLFAQNRNGQVGLRGNEQTGIRFYSCQIYDGDNLVRNFVPAMNGSKVGVYDQVGKNFYENKGNGSMDACVSCLAYENGSFVTKYLAGEWLDGNSAIFSYVHYAAAGQTVFRDRVKFTGEHTIILCDGADLVFEKGIQLEYGATLNIYARSQSENMGRLTVYGYGGNAAIGGNRGTDYAENPTDRDGKPGGTVNIHGGNIEVYSETVGFGGGNGGIGTPGDEGSNGGKGGKGGDAMGGNIYGGNVTLHSGRALFGGGNGGKGGEGIGAALNDITMQYGLIRSGDGGDGGVVYSVMLYGGSVQLPSGAGFVLGGDGGGGGSGDRFFYSYDMAANYCDASYGGDGGNGGDILDVQFLGNTSVSGDGICISGGRGGIGGNGADVEADSKLSNNTRYFVDGGYGGDGGNGGNAKVTLRGGNSTVSYGNVFFCGGNAGSGGAKGKVYNLPSNSIFSSGNSGKEGKGASCEMNVHGGKLTLSSSSGKLMGSGTVNYYNYMAARLGRTLDSLGEAGRYNAGQFGTNACAIIESISEIVPPVEHNGNDYWLNTDYTSPYFLSDDVKGDVTLDLKGHTWTVTGEEIFGYGVTMLEIKNGTLTFINPKCEAFVIEDGLRLDNVTFKDCTCERLFYISEDKTTKNDDYSSFVVRNCLFENCSFTKDGGAFFFACKNSPRWYYLFENTVFDNITTTGDGSAMYIHAYNGGMYDGVTWPSLDLVGCTFNKCHADGSGGAIYAMENMRIGNFLDECGNKDRSENNVRSNLFVNCTADKNGGALYNAGWDCSTLYCIFVSNISKTGGVYSGSQPVHFSKCDFLGNKMPGIKYDEDGKAEEVFYNMDIFHDYSYGHGMEEKDVIYDMSRYTSLEGEGTESKPYILQNAYDIAFLAAKCKANDTTYSFAVYQLGDNITDVFTPVSGFSGILNTNGKKISTRFTGNAFTGTYGINGTLTVEDILGKVSTEGSKNNFRHMDSNQPYDGNVNKGRAYIRPGASSITLTFSNDTSAGWSGARIIIYDGNGHGIEYKGSELQGVTKTVQGDTVRVWISPDGRSFKVTNITVTYPTNGVGSTLSGGDIWIIAGVALACTAVIAVLFIRKKKNAN